MRLLKIKTRREINLKFSSSCLDFGVHYIESIEVFDLHKKDCDRGIAFNLFDGTQVSTTCSFINKTPLSKFFNEMLKMIREEPLKRVSSPSKKTKKTNEATISGITMGHYGTVNKSFDEEKFNARQGHGFAAESANTLVDNLTDHPAKVIGDDNQLNGADRIVDGVYIQSKYCATGLKCIDDCFNSNGQFRYMMDGSPMQIEVPSDKYDAAVKAMEERIRRGQVHGVTDPKESKNIVRKGHFTYEQAKNIAKSGTVESLTYDAANGAVIATSASGVTFMISFATSVWNGEDLDSALKMATCSGLKVFGTAFDTSIIVSQLSKAGLNSALVGSSEAIVSFMGPKASSVLVNAFRSGGNIYGGAAMKSAAKLIRSNVITAGVTVVVLSAFDVANIFQGRISGKQLFKNVTNTTSTVIGGTGGWIGGAAAGTAILPGVGTVIGGLIGSAATGAVFGKASEKVMSGFIEDDADAMVRIIESEFTELAVAYLLNHKEAEKTIDKLGEKLDAKVMKDMFASDNRNAFARELLVPIIENEVSKRSKIYNLSSEEMAHALKTVLEELSEEVQLHQA